MKTEDVISYFGSKANVAKALNIGRPAVTNWGENVPLARQFEIQVLTKGKLKDDLYKE